jgi:GT2 family glycosyltransferase
MKQGLSGERRIALLIVSYHQEIEVQRLLSSLPSGLGPYRPTICLVENEASDEPRVDWPRWAQTVDLPLLSLRSPRNLGFAEGNNAAWRLLQKHGPFDYYVLLNPDTEVSPGWLETLLQPFHDPEIGLTGSTLFFPDGRINAWGCKFHFLGFGYMAHFQESPASLSTASCPTYPCGAALALSHSALEKVQTLSGDSALFWPDLFLYHDDLELGLRVLLAGLRSQLVRESRVIHYHEFIGTSRNDRKFFYQERNRFLVLIAYYKTATLLLLIPWLCVMEVIFLLKEIGLSRSARWQVYRQLAREFSTRSFWTRRQTVQKNRVRSDRALLAHFSGKMEHPVVTPGWQFGQALVHGYYQILRRVIWW